MKKRILIIIICCIVKYWDFGITFVIRNILGGFN